MVGKEREVSDKSSVEKGSKVSESEHSDLIVGSSRSDLISAGVCCGNDEEGEEEEDEKDRMNQVASAEVIEMIQKIVVKTTKEMMRW